MWISGFPNTVFEDAVLSSIYVLETFVKNQLPVDVKVISGISL
jgi:hypothetical protein